MQSVLACGDSGTPLLVVERASYSVWLEGQDASVQQWLKQTGFEGKGVSLVPGEGGSLRCVVLGVASLDDYFICGDLTGKLPAGDYSLEGDEVLLRRAAFSWSLGAYHFDRYLSEKGKMLPKLFVGSQAIVDEATIFSQAVALTRDLINTPAQDMMPEHLGEAAVSLATEFGAEVSQLVGDQLLENNYPTVHAVGRASHHAPRMIDLNWGDSSHPLVTLVGKGVCFDSGGLDLKAPAGMRLMKKDMGGAAHVLGLARMIMACKLPVRLRVLIPAVENAVAGNAFHPGDVITTRKGMTVEIHNTDAEGRLVLCDALTEASQQKPELIVDFATLTGACRVALGTELPGFYTDDNELAVELTQLGDDIDDPVWRMPLHKTYRKMLNSDIADISNCAKEPFAGSITAALYLQEFVENDTPWLHFDIMGWNLSGNRGRPVGGEAFGIRAVFELLRRRFAV